MNEQNNIIEHVSIDAHGNISYRLKHGIHVYTDDENQLILDVVEHLRDENERLRSEEAHYIMYRAASEKKLDDLKDENEKLRELCRDLDYCRTEAYCATCPHGGMFCDLGISERLKELEVPRRND